MRTRFPAWLALVAMMLGIVLPAHGHAGRAASDGPGSEMCIDGKIVHVPAGAPAGSHDTACDACSSCFGGGPLPAAHIVAPLAFTAVVVAANPTFAAHAAPVVGLPPPRGPPLA
jgi:hypothetical protein